MKLELICLLFLIFAKTTTKAQIPDYVNNYFQYKVSKDINYGKDISYDGTETELLLDIYKPTNDGNCRRPLMIMVHGGAWIGGSKEDLQIVEMSKELASKGWVVASINYRLGMHTTSSYTPYLLCPANNPALCARVSDTSEVIRAIYRGMQDAKGAIRFMKLRADLDSTDINNTFVAGESAGAFISIYSAFLDQDDEKPSSCGQLSNAPKPDSYLNYCHKASPNLTRPDLGDIHGKLHIGAVDESVQGVGCIYGGFLDMNILLNKALPIYIFHQASDILVDYKKSKLLSRLSTCLYNICEPFYNMPVVSGGFLIGEYYKNLGIKVPPYTADIIENSTASDCTINPPGHAIDNISLRVKNMVSLFAPIIISNGNSPKNNCSTSVFMNNEVDHISLYPNPGVGGFILSGLQDNHAIDKISLFDALGRNLPIKIQIISEGVIEVKTEATLTPGLYLCQIRSQNNKWSKVWISNKN